MNKTAKNTNVKTHNINEIPLEEVIDHVNGHKGDCDNALQSKDESSNNELIDEEDSSAMLRRSNASKVVKEEVASSEIMKSKIEENFDNATS